MAALRKMTIEKIKQIPSMVDTGMNYFEIADHFGVHRSTIAKWVRKLKFAKVELNSKPGPKPLKL